MSRNHLSQGSSDLSPEKIVDLGERLASTESYQDKKEIVINFLEENYGIEGNVWLKTSPKSGEESVNLDKFPFDPATISSDTEITTNAYSLSDTDAHYWTALPLCSGANAYGKLLLKHKAPFQNYSLRSLESVSKLAGLALFSSLQQELQQWQKKQLALVQSVSEQISQITDLDILTHQITKLIQQTFTYNYVAIFLISEMSGRLHFKASAIEEKTRQIKPLRPEFESETHPGFAVGEHMIGYVAQSGHELVANNVTNETRYKKVDSLADTKSEVVIPLKIENSVLGILDVQSEQLNAFDDNDLLVLRALADNIAIAIESTRLYQGVQRQADQLSAVSKVSRAITVILDIDELLQKVVNLIHEQFQFPQVQLYTVDPVQKVITFKAGSGVNQNPQNGVDDSFELGTDCGVLSWVVQNGETKRINNINQDPLLQPTKKIHKNVGSELAVPLSFGGDILGVLDLQSEQTDAFSQQDQQLIETLADNIAVAMRNARLYHTEKWRRQVAESLRDVAGLLSDNFALSDLLNEILTQLHKNLPCDITSIWLFEKEIPHDTSLESQNLNLAAYQTSEDFQRNDLGQLRFLPDAWVRQSLSNSDPTIRQPEDSKGPVAQHFDLPQDYSSIAAPLHTGKEILGMLTLDHHTPGRYGLESQKIVSAFASYAAIAIKNTRLFITSQEQAWISTILLQVATATQSITNLDELVATIVRITPMVVGIRGCALFLKEPGEDYFNLYASYGIGDPFDTLLEDQPVPYKDAPILKELSNTQDPLILDNPKEDLNLPEDFTDLNPQDTFILQPLIARDDVLGALLVTSEYDHTKAIQTNEERIKLIQGIAQQTSVAIANIKLLEEKQEEAYVSTVLLQAAEAVVSSADLQDTLDSIVHIMPILVGIDASLVYLWNEDDEKFHTSQAATKGTTKEEILIGTAYSMGDFPMLDAVYQNNRPIVYPFVETILPPEDWDLALPDEGQTDPAPILQSHYPLLMGFPLSMKGNVFGVLLALEKSYSPNRERRFELLWGMAQQASLAIQNDVMNQEMIERQRMEREFQLAREIQQTFLPNQKPEMPGWEMDVYWETARLVGGDFYDYFLLSDGRLAIVIADVSDKGLAASLYMTVTRTLLRAAALESDSPSSTLERVNDLLLANSQNGLFVTTFYGILSLQNGLLDYSVAGHNPPLILRCQEKEIIELEKGGMAIGALPDIKLNQNQEILHPGDCIVLYTDGVTEAFNFDDQMYGDERLSDILMASIGQPARNVIDLVKKDLDNFRGNAPLSDDTTILAICRNPLFADHHGDVRTS